MKNNPKREYEVFNMVTREWETKVMTDEEYLEFVETSKKDADEINAEYEIVTRIVSQNMGLPTPPIESMD
jgi:hypothetical protein|tara:strand:- start:53 stop:262 length:210 start_codon:yes stop_codon:yes gene_type:complete